MWLCVIKQEAAHLITALRPHCMMVAGRQVRVEHGTPTTPTHPPGYTQHQYDCLQYVSLCIAMFFFNQSLSPFQKWGRVWLWLWWWALPVPAGIWGNPEPSDPGLPWSPLATGQPPVQPSDPWHACYVSVKLLTHMVNHKYETTFKCKWLSKYFVVDHSEQLSVQLVPRLLEM